MTRRLRLTLLAPLALAGAFSMGCSTLQGMSKGGTVQSINLESGQVDPNAQTQGGLGAGNLAGAAQGQGGALGNLAGAANAANAAQGGQGGLGSVLGTADAAGQLANGGALDKAQALGKLASLPGVSSLPGAAYVAQAGKLAGTAKDVQAAVADPQGAGAAALGGQLPGGTGALAGPAAGAFAGRGAGEPGGIIGALNRPSGAPQGAQSSGAVAALPPAAPAYGYGTIGARGTGPVGAGARRNGAVSVSALMGGPLPAVAATPMPALPAAYAKPETKPAEPKVGTTTLTAAVVPAPAKPPVAAAASKPAPAIPAPAVAASPTANSAPRASADDAPKAPKGVPDLYAFIGTSQEGWAPRAFSSLKKGMVPAQVAQFYAGADKVDSNGFVEVKAQGTEGVVKYRFFFARVGTSSKVGLRDVTVYFDKSMKSQAAFDYLVKITAKKYGDVSKEDARKKSVTWVSESADTAQLSKDKSTGSYSLQVDFH